MPICIAPRNSGWLLSYAKKPKNSPHIRLCEWQKSSTIMERIVLVGFLPCDNGHSCNLHPFGCGLWELDGDQSSWLQSWHSSSHSNDDGSKWTCLLHHEQRWIWWMPCFFVAREYAAGENACRLDGRIIKIMQAYQSDDENRSMRWLFHHNRGYPYAVVENNH